ncbi:autophagy-related protein 27 [Chytriomyces sp. MP71]|nr:autophagy-related protein 27 [Chytriomyces sp. MP71]
MRSSSARRLAALAALSAAAAATAATAPNDQWTCAAVVHGGFHFNVAALTANDVVLSASQDTPPSTTRLVTALNICKPLEKDHLGPAESPCAADAWLCQISTVTQGSATVTAAVKSWALGPPATENIAVTPNGRGLSVLLKGGKWGGLDLRTNLSLICAEGVTSSDPVIDADLSTESLLHVSWKTEAGCGKRNGSIGTGSGSMSISGLLFLLFVLTVFFYITIGTAFNILVKRVNRFPDCLPNWPFWENLLARATQRNRYVRI